MENQRLASLIQECQLLSRKVILPTFRGELIPNPNALQIDNEGTDGKGMCIPTFEDCNGLLDDNPYLVRRNL
jgi:hypothetical protein